MKKLILALSSAVLGLAFFVVPAFAASQVVYDALPSVTPATNYTSQPFQAQQTNEFGDYIHLGGTARMLNTVTVTMSDWAQYSEYSTDSRYSGNNQTWTHPITLNIYTNHLGSNGVPDQKIATVTQNITIPWRPAGDPSCPNTGYGAGYAWKNSSGVCVNGLAFNATFDLSSLNVTLPNDIIVSVAYNTQTWGYSPIGTAGPYNSLNVAVPPNQAVSVGSDDSNNKVFWNTETAAWYADGGAAGVGIFREDTNWAPYGTVALQVTANFLVPTDMSQCKNGGWKTFSNPSFKNQGDCVSYVQSNPNAVGNKSK